MRFFRHALIGLTCLAIGFLVIYPTVPTQAQSSAPAKGKPALYEFGAGLLCLLQGDG